MSGLNIILIADITGLMNFYYYGIFDYQWNKRKLFERPLRIKAERGG